MKQYNVYGIGNALVDLEYRVNEEFLAKNNIDKGVMTLIDEQREVELFSIMSDHDCKMACGGSAANTIIAVSQLGGKSFYSCKVADDDIGHFYTDDLHNEGVDSNLNNDKEEGTTGKCMVFVTPDADRTMNTYLGITQGFSEKELCLDGIAKSEWIYIEGYLVASESGKAAAIKARKHAEENGVKTSLTLSDPNMVKFFKDGLLEMIGDKVDLLFCNHEEALGLFGSSDLDALKEDLKKVAKTFCVTMGPDGSLVYDGHDFHQIPGNKVNAVDTVGAGDMYAGAFLYAITHKMDYRQAGVLASLASSKIVSQYGPRMAKNQTRALLN